MTYDTIQLDCDDHGVMRLWLNRPAKHNAINALMIAELTDAVAAIAADASVRVVVLGGRGKSFCAGGDLNWMKEQFDGERPDRIGQARALAGVFSALNDLPQPLLGRVHGGSFGGGLGFMSVCDSVIATDTAKFGLTEVRLGLIPATIGPYVVACMGQGNARRVFMSGRIFGSDEAQRLGLVAEVCSADALDHEIEQQIAPYLAAKPGAVLSAKSLVRALAPPIGQAQVEETIVRLADRWETEEARQGISDFLASRS